MLQQLSGAPKPGERLADLRAVSDSDQLAMDAPCKNDTVHFLATAYPPSSELRPPVLRSWNVNDQSFTEHLLVDERGTPAPVTHPSYGFMVDGMNSHSLRDGNLDWMGVFNSVNTTELSTGVTRELFTVPGDIDVAADLRAPTFTDTSFVSATIWDERDKATVTIQDRLTGDVTSTFEVPFAVRARDQGLILRSVAVRPGL
ncbi:hypothetical protein D9V32_05700 [Mycetocola tolaasinivorans]|uniref:Uncharacterized protein n=1 Tax=Mycetocola tolaasinivorans TaxID=76635 RepID=A0A3L7A8H9_9MICO|nr:hypothetical protein [Mycetocola tolaasinivorans]RLP76364.1 hypothetical protein D9V32_05700 [Mycetocola tolaasinivorans]